MTDQVVFTRISEDPANFRSVFDMAMQTAAAVKEMRLEHQEATAIARNAAIGEKILNADIKGRLVDARLRAKDVAQQRLS